MHQFLLLIILLTLILQKKVSKDGFRVLISGVGADEIFSGYYDHTLQFLQEIKIKSILQKSLKIGKKIQVHIRNPLFKIQIYVSMTVIIEIIFITIIDINSFS